MSIGHMSLRIARWIVFSVAAVNVAVSVSNGDAGRIVNIAFGAACYLLMIELLWRVWQAVIGGNVAIGFGQRTQDRTPYRHGDHDDSSRSYNPATGLPMVGTTDVGGRHWGGCD